MEYRLTILSKREATQDIETLLEDKHHTLEYDGYKRMVYQFDGYDHAHYYYTTLHLSQLEVKLLQKYLERENWCMRFLLVKSDTKKQHHLKKTIAEWADEWLGGIDEGMVDILIEQLGREFDNE